MSYDLMVDIETLATNPQAVVLQVAAAKFSPVNDMVKAEDTWQWNLDITGDEQKYRDIDSRTVLWWNAQDKAVRDIVWNQACAVPAIKVFEILAPLMNDANRLWARSPEFDYPILYTLWDDAWCNAAPYDLAMRNRRKHRDERVLSEAMAAAGIARSPNLQKHDAMSDVMCQVRNVQRAYAAMRSKNANVE